MIGRWLLDAPPEPVFGPAKPDPLAGHDTVLWDAPAA